MKLKKKEAETTTLKSKWRYFEDGPYNEHNFTQGYAEVKTIDNNITSRMYWVNQENIGFVLKLTEKYYYI
jgi:hypothetical protein